jgi:hypothetical protein
MTETAEPLAHACELVGRFLYYFSRVELQLDDAITKLFKLDPTYAPIVTANIDFFKKRNIVQCAVDLHTKSGKRISVDAKEVFDEVERMNARRRVVAHSAFEAEAGGVRFARAVADKELKRLDPLWEKEKFQGYFGTLEQLEKKLQQIIRELEPEMIEWPRAAAYFLG